MKSLLIVAAALSALFLSTASVQACPPQQFNACPQQLGYVQQFVAPQQFVQQYHAPQQFIVRQQVQAIHAPQAFVVRPQRVQVQRVQQLNVHHGVQAVVIDKRGPLQRLLNR